MCILFVMGPVCFIVVGEDEAMKMRWWVLGDVNKDWKVVRGKIGIVFQEVRRKGRERSRKIQGR